MPRCTLTLLLFVAFVLSPSSTQAKASIERGSSSLGVMESAARVPAPEDVLGFRPGDDRKLASWASVVEYFRRLDRSSDRLLFEELGQTTMGAPFVMATISAPENLARLDDFKNIQRQLADPRTLGASSDSKARALIARGRTIVLITCGIHSTEVGSYLSSMLIAHKLASSDDPLILDILRNSIILLVPSLNPDGVDIVKNWYDRTLGTPFEGTEPPELYHKYTGHDNNRDWYAFTQVETQLTVDKIHNVWRPQIVHDIHQQGPYGSRLFLPPYAQPVEPNVPRQIVEGYTELGNSMATEMRASGFKGIVTDAIYDAWTPARAYSHYHGGVRILSETASAKIATPIKVNFDELRAGRGYDSRKVSANFPEVWNGGEWRLRDITNYMTTAAFSLLKHAAENRERWLTRFYETGKEAVRPRKKGELWGFKIKSDSSWTSYYLEEILARGGIEIIYTKVEPYGKSRRGKGPNRPLEAIVRMDQPSGAFAKALLEAQRYPDLRDAAGDPLAPYDVTAHTLPLLMDVEVQPLYAPVKYSSQSAKRIEFMLGKGSPFTRVAVYKSYVPSMDEGWTRWAIQHDANFHYDSRLTTEAAKGGNLYPLTDREARAGNLRARYDAVVIPDQPARAIFEGHRRGTMPDEFTGGMGEEGVRALRDFVEQGGTLVCLNRASVFAIEQLKLPVRDITAGLKRTEFFVPGSILRIELDRTHPVAEDMRQARKFGYDEERMTYPYEKVAKESIAWVESSPVFEIKDGAGASARIIARYPQTGDPLLSGWLLGGERIKGKAALVEVKLGKGRIYLFGFRPQYRGQSLATYELFFNAIKQSGGN